MRARLSRQTTSSLQQVRSGDPGGQRHPPARAAFSARGEATRNAYGDRRLRGPVNTKASAGPPLRSLVGCCRRVEDAGGGALRGVDPRARPCPDADDAEQADEDREAKEWRYLDSIGAN